MKWKLMRFKRFLNISKKVSFQFPIWKLPESRGGGALISSMRSSWDLLLMWICPYEPTRGLFPDVSLPAVWGRSWMLSHPPCGWLLCIGCLWNCASWVLLVEGQWPWWAAGSLAAFCGLLGSSTKDFWSRDAPILLAFQVHLLCKVLALNPLLHLLQLRLCLFQRSDLCCKHI